jgi:hypothetical protein
MIVLRLTHAEAAALSAAAVWADGQHRHPTLQAARIKLREALNRGEQHELDEDECYVALEC